MTRNVALERAALLGGAAGALVLRMALHGNAAMSLTGLLLAAAATAALLAVAELAHLRRTQADASALPLLGGASACLLLAVVCGDQVLGWRFFGLPGIGVVLGLMLLTSVAGTALLAADRLCPGASVLAPVLARRLLMMSGGFGVIAAGLIVKASISSGALPPSIVADVAAGILWSTALLLFGSAALLAEGVDPDPSSEERGRRFAVLAAAAAAAGLLCAGIFGWRDQGSYWAGAARPTLVAALAGIAAAQPAGYPFLRLVLFVAALVGAFLAG